MDSVLILLVTVMVSCTGLLADGQIQLPVPTTLTDPITRAGCGSSKVCFEAPSGCEPSGDSPCIFTSSRLSGSGVEFELSSSSSAEVGLGVTINSPENPKVFFVCSNNNGSFRFQILNKDGSPADLMDSSLLVVNSVQGSVGPGRVQCTFSTSTISSTNRLAKPGTDIIIIRDGDTIIIIVVHRESRGLNVGGLTPVFNATVKLSSNSPPSNYGNPVSSPVTQVLLALLSALGLYHHFY